MVRVMDYLPAVALVAAVAFVLWFAVRLREAPPAPPEDWIAALRAERERRRRGMGWTC